MSSGAVSAMLCVQRLSAHFGGTAVLQDIDLACHAGQWLAVVGPNGAGKSTLLRCMAGLLMPSRGQVLLEGVAMRPDLNQPDGIHPNETGARIVATGNPGCLMQIAQQCRAEGFAVEVVHPVSLLARALREP